LETAAGEDAQKIIRDKGRRFSEEQLAAYVDNRADTNAFVMCGVAQSESESDGQPRDVQLKVCVARKQR
jgi:hypothetical protein